MGKRTEEEESVVRAGEGTTYEGPNGSVTTSNLNNNNSTSSSSASTSASASNSNGSENSSANSSKISSPTEDDKKEVGEVVGDANGGNLNLNTEADVEEIPGKTSAVSESVSAEEEEESNRKRGRQRQRDRNFGFGLSLAGLFSSNKQQGDHCRLGGTRSSSQSTERLVIMNNEVGGTNGSSSSSNGMTRRLSSLSKSSSESNIPMCHNSFGELTYDLPSSCSTDSSCLIPQMDGNQNLKVSSTPNPNFTYVSNICGENSSARAGTSKKNNNINATATFDNGNGTEDEFGNKKSSNFPNNPSTSASAGGVSEPSTSQSMGRKFKLIFDGELQVCKVKHGQNLMGKLASSKLLRRWETHHLFLNDTSISSKTPIGCLTTPISYWQMEEVYVVVQWDCGRRYVIRIVVPDGSLLLQGSNAYVRDQWYHSIIWKKNIFKYQNLMRSCKRPEVILKELKGLVDYATSTPLHDDCISHVPIEIVSNLLDSGGELLGKSQTEEVLVALSPLLEKYHPPPSLCRFFSLRCRTRPRCPLVEQLFTPIVRRALKHNVDFGKFPYMRQFIQDYILALNCQNDGINVVRNFVKSMHGPASSCPHPKVMSNLVSVCLAALFAIFERNNAKRVSNLSSETIKEIPWDEQMLPYLAVFDAISEFEDWRPHLAQLLQPIPFPDDALTNPLFTKSMSSVIRRIGTDHRCEVHQMVMEIRDGKEGWFHLYSPSNLACSDDSELWGLMLERLLSCCFRRKRFLTQLGGKLLGSCLFLALGREHAAAQEALCLLLEWQLISSEDQRVQIATTLQSTPTGSANYDALCSRQLHLTELQQKGGPRKLTLPSRSTDADLAKLLSCGSFGNLECLSLAFTQVTSACAEQLIKLPSLRYLNLWSTQFGDSGLQLISEHLPSLQVLNLCETPVTDKGLLSLIAMTSLRKLNLNSTHLSAETFESIKQELPALKEVDIRYTDAW